MDSNKSKICKFRPCLMAFFIFIITPLLYAHNEESGQVVRTSEGFQITQTISFPAVPNVLRYEVEIERLVRGRAVPVEKIETQTNSIEVSLRAGDYRYRITAYNRMNLLEGRSEWQNFEVFPATAPAVESYRPFYGLFFELSDTSRSLTITGTDFYPSSEFALVRRRPDFDWTGVTLENRSDVIKPFNVEVDENRAVLTFARNDLKRGEYEIFIRNRGGLWSCFGIVKVGFKSNNDFIFSFSYSPMIALFDIENALRERNINGDWTDFQQLDRFNPAGFNIHIAWFPLKSRIGNFGLGLQFYFLVDKVMRMKNDYTDYHSGFYEPMTYGTINLLYQFPIGERWQNNIKFGFSPGGDSYHTARYTFMNEWGYEQSEKEHFDSVYLNFGYYAQYFFWKNFYIEAGLDIQYVVMLNKNIDNHLILRPALGMGFQFGRWSEYAEVSGGARKGEDYSVPVTEPPKNEHLLSIGWSPMIPLFGIDRYAIYEIQDSTGDRNHEQGTSYSGPFNPLGLNFRYAWLPHRWGKNKLGIEIEISLLEHANRDVLVYHNKVAGVFDLISEAILGIRYQYVLNDDWQINARAGIGYAKSYNYIEYDPSNSRYQENGGYNSFGGLGFKLGASAQYFFRQNLYAEAELNWTIILANKTAGTIRPGIGIGWQFNRNAETGLRLPEKNLSHSAKTDSDDTDMSDNALIDIETPLQGETPTAAKKITALVIISKFAFSVNWSPLIPLGGEDSLYSHDPNTGERGNARVLNYFNPASGGFRVAWLPLQWGKNKLGIEVEYYFIEYAGENFYITTPNGKLKEW